MADDASFPTGAQIIDANRGGVIGRGVDRVDGPAKVTGAAPYAYEFMGADKAAYGVIVQSPIARGRVSAVDTSRAEASPGVELVWTHLNAPPQGDRDDPQYKNDQMGAPKPVLASDRIAYFGHPVGFVVADSFESARAAARLLDLRFEAEPADVALTEGAGYRPQPGHDTDVGDFEAAFAAAPVQLDVRYETPIENHCQMEPHATTADWKDGKLTVYTSTQLLKLSQRAVGATLKMDHHDIQVISRYIGGGFGGKLGSGADTVFAALASRALERPVKVAITRQQLFHVTTHRTRTLQRIRLGAEADGRLTAIGHEGWVHSSRGVEFTETVAAFTRSMYAAPNRITRHRLSRLDLPDAGAVRAPGEAVGMLSLECAMDELAERVGVDPIELRIRNEPLADPETGKPFSSRHLVECMREGAARFGWSARNPTPGAVREGRQRIGIGMAAAIRSNYLQPAKATLRIDADGTATVLQAMTDIGTGSYTILAQIAAETLGLPVERVKVTIGDSKLAPTFGSGGSFGAASSGSALLDAGMNLRRKLAEMAVADPRSPLHGGEASKAVFSDGAVRIENRSETLADLVARLAPEGVEIDGEIKPPKNYNDWSQHAFGAYFAEVAVDADTGETRLRRMLGVFAAGRILNEKTARSQVLGGMIWGVGQALTEENVIDPRYGSFMNQDLASYHVPSHADIPDIDASFLPEHDDKGNPLGIKGVGELGICGAGASLANAVYNATGVRVRDYPLTLDKLIGGM